MSSNKRATNPFFSENGQFFNDMIIVFLLLLMLLFSLILLLFSSSRLLFRPSVSLLLLLCIFRMMKNGASSTPTRPVIHPYDPSEDVMSSPACHVAMEVSNLVTPQPLLKEKRSTKWAIEDFNIGRRLGEGSYSTVILAEEKKTGFLCALKVIKVLGQEGDDTPLFCFPCCRNH